ncbi:MAG: hypothetical protein LBK82_00435 [Planctomycetaceae bacterium]|jgi:hypothetical protein|nr:hypothetical protein [Planctomycetaceae bacterium]
MASESVEVQTEMEMEDDFMKELQDKERSIAEQTKTIEADKKALEEKDKLIKELKEQLAKSQI